MRSRDSILTNHSSPGAAPAPAAAPAPPEARPRARGILIGGLGVFQANILTSFRFMCQPLGRYRFIYYWWKTGQYPPCTVDDPVGPHRAALRHHVPAAVRARLQRGHGAVLLEHRAPCPGAARDGHGETAGQGGDM